MLQPPCAQSTSSETNNNEQLLGLNWKITTDDIPIAAPTLEIVFVHFSVNFRRKKQTSNCSFLGSSLKVGRINTCTGKIEL